MILVHDFLTASANRHSEKPAIIAEDKVHTFGQIHQESDRLACALQRQGLVRGDRVALLMENSPASVVSVFGILKAGGVFVSLNPTTKTAKLTRLLNDCGARVLIVQGSLSQVARPAAADAPSLRTVIWIEAPRQTPGHSLASERAFEEIVGESPSGPAHGGAIDEDVCAIIYTSGSTGAPKGVMLTHHNVTNTAWAISTYLENTPDDVVICTLPLSFGYGLFQVITGMRVGFTVVLERSFAYPYRSLQRMAEHGVTGLPGVPTTFATLLPMDAFNHRNIPSLRYLTNAGAAIPPAHLRRLREAFPQARIFSMYGLTECTRVCYLDPARLDDKITSVGKAMPNTEAYIVDEQGRRVGPGVVGELVVRGANVMRGYWGLPDETRRRLCDGEVPGEKVLYTGDLFRMDEEGFLYFAGRKDEIFKCKGEKISPREIEDVLHELDAVAEAAVIGVDDPIDGMAIKAFVVPRYGAALTEQQVRQHCRGHLESYMVPKFVEIRSSLPKTDSGKVLKTALS